MRFKLQQSQSWIDFEQLLIKLHLEELSPEFRPNWTTMNIYYSISITIHSVNSAWNKQGTEPLYLTIHSLAAQGQYNRETVSWGLHKLKPIESRIFYNIASISAGSLFYFIDKEQNCLCLSWAKQLYGEYIGSVEEIKWKWSHSVLSDSLRPHGL